MRSILVHPRVPDEDDPDIRRMLDLTAALTGASWVELEVEPEEGEVRRYLKGQRAGNCHSTRLDLKYFSTCLHLGGVDTVSDTLSDVVSFSLQQIFRCRRCSEQVSLLQGALEETSNAVWLFDDNGDLVYANPPADRLLSRQTEDELEVESSGQRPQPMFMRVWSMVEKVLNGQVTQLPWTTTLVLSDSSVLVCEIIRVTLDSSTDRVGVLVLLQSLPALPSLFLDAFCARHRVSPREQEVIGLLLEGLGTSDMAERLGISDHTVRDHLKRLYRKTSTRSRSELMSVLSMARMEPPNVPPRRETIS